ncbi:MAG TPA: hypothetical protein VLB06_13080 [Sulfuricaulis sp.]|nr:hypothetical protein [Sulfuricaulis sp.]
MFSNRPVQILKVLPVRLKGKQANVSLPGQHYRKEADVGANVHDKSTRFRQFAGCGNKMSVDDCLVSEVNMPICPAKYTAVQIQSCRSEPVQRNKQMLNR